MKTNEVIKQVCEGMYQEFLDRDCNDLLEILAGRLQIAVSENQLETVNLINSLRPDLKGRKIAPFELAEGVGYNIAIDDVLKTLQPPPTKTDKQ